MPYLNKSLVRKRIRFRTPFSHSTLKLERKKFYAAKLLALSLYGGWDIRRTLFL